MESRLFRWLAALAFASCIGTAHADVPRTGAHAAFERHCRSCHGGTTAADLPIGPDLRGIVGRKAATRSSGVYSRALIDSGIVWNRDTLRRFLSSPSATMPDNHASFGRNHPDELESVLDYLETLRDSDGKPTAQ